MTRRERLERRAERLKDWSLARRQKAASAFKGAHDAVAGIPMGQPILVGHHSEKRHRRDLERHDSKMSQAFEHQGMAESMSSRANGIEIALASSIYSDDPDAIEQLTAKLADLEAKRDAMKAANVAYRKVQGARLKAMSAYDRSQSVPHPAYELQNLSGNITRTRERIKYLSGTPVVGGRVEGETATARAGLVVTASMTTPTRAGKKPRPVWNVTGNHGAHRQTLIDLGGNFYRGSFSFWEDPTADLEAALTEKESQ